MRHECDLKPVKITPAQSYALQSLTQCRRLLGIRDEWRVNWSLSRETPIAGSTMRGLVDLGLVKLGRVGHTEAQTASLTMLGETLAPGLVALAMRGAA